MSQTIEQNVINHYQQGGLLGRIESRLKESGTELNSVKQSDLSFLDELHIGGQEMTIQLAKTAALPEGTTVLDVGCGLGGPARMLATEYGCRVTGLDLTEEFCKTAEILTQAVGLSEKVDFINGNALDIPFEPETFDAIWSQHCSMNIKDKLQLYTQFSKVVKTGGKLVIHDITAGSNQPVHFPVPWAKEPSVNFLISEEELLNLLEEKGFKPVHWQDVSEKALNWFKQQKIKPAAGDKPLLSQKLVFGHELKTMAKNVIRNLEEERIKVIEGVLEKQI